MDPKKDKEFTDSESWKGELLVTQLFEKQADSEDGPFARSNSLSGNERNRLFLASRGEGNYVDVSLLSGMDCPEDGRGFALWDYDDDGWQDVVLVNPQAPRVRVFKNRMDEVLGLKSGRVAIKLVGGNVSAQPSLSLSNRDAVGAQLIVTDEDGGKRRFLKSTGEGRSSQNSGWIWIGMGDEELIPKIEVVWPSGKRQILRNITVGMKLQIEEFIRK